MSEEFRSAIASFDAVAWSTACRHMQIRLLHSNVEAAVAVLRAFCRVKQIACATLSSSVHAVLDTRTANALDEAGFSTVASIAKATDAQLIAVPNCGKTTIDRIRRLVSDVEHGRVIEDCEEDRDLCDPETLVPPFILRYLADIFQELSVNSSAHQLTAKTPSAPAAPAAPTDKPITDKPVTDKQRVLDAIRTLAGSPDTTVEAIDAHIRTMEADLAKLKQFRKAFGTPTKSASDRTARDDSRVVELLEESGPLTPSEIGQKLSLRCQHVGKIVASSARLEKQGKTVCLKDWG